MIYEIIISAIAKRNLQAAYEWYESQQPFLGKEFRQEFEITVEKLSGNLVDYQIYKDNIRKSVLNRFPYYIYYRRNESQRVLLILAVLHSKRGPDEITNTLG